MSSNAVANSRSDFYQAKSMASRIVTLLRKERRSPAEERRLGEFPFHDPKFQQPERIVFEIGPECQQIYREIHDAPSLSTEELDSLEARLRLELERAEDPRPEVVEELERYLFRPVCFS